MSMIVYCPECGKTVSVNAKFCRYCGTRISAVQEEKTFCPQCGRQCEPGERFCENCGAELTPDTPVEPRTAGLESFGGFGTDGIGNIQWDISSEQLEAQQESYDAQRMENFEYTRNPDGTYIVTRFKGMYDDSVTVPDCVKVIAEGAFEGARLIEVTLPEKLNFIGAGAFRNCRYLEKINIPSSVSVIEDEAFAGCEKLDIVIPSTVRNPGKDILSGTKKEHLAWEKEEAKRREREKQHEIFECDEGGCVRLKDKNTVGHIIIPGDVAGIAPHTFEKCAGITGVTILVDVIDIVDGMFDGCTNLSYVTFKGEMAQADKKETADQAGLPTLIIPSDVLRVGESAFRNCSRFTDISIGDNVMEIGDAAFANCISLERVRIGKRVICIGEYAFHNCPDLKTVKIPDGVTSIGDGAFRKCVSLENVQIPNTVTSIGDRAFQGCAKLTGIDIPSSVKHLGSRAFLDCAGLKKIRFAGTREQWKSLHIPKSILNVSITCTDGKA